VPEVTKVNLDNLAAFAVSEVARRENRTLSNAASTMIRREWNRRIEAMRAAAAPNMTNKISRS
jgi:hypothetical protein